MCLKIYVNDQTIKTATLTYLILISHSEKHKTKWHFQTQSFTFSFPNVYCCVGVGDKLNIRKRGNRRLETVI